MDFTNNSGEEASGSAINTVVDSPPRPFPNTFSEFSPATFGEASGSASAVDNMIDSPPRPFPNRFPGYYPTSPRRERFGNTNNEDYVTRERGSSAGRDDAKSCFAVSFTFSSFVAIALAFGLYSSRIFQLGPNTSILINPNRLLVESIQVEALDASRGLMMYGFDKTPPLDVLVSWSEFHNITFPGGTHKEWMYYLNKGSQLNLSYYVDSLHASSLVLAIIEGDQSLAMWLEDPSNPFATFSWSNIHGNGARQEDILESSSYFVAVGNLNNEIVKAYLTTSIKALLYNTKESYYKCSPAESNCTLEMLLSGQNSVVIETPGPTPGIGTDRWNIKLSYRPRWLAYLVGAGGVTGLLQLINFVLNRFWRRDHSAQGDAPPEEAGAERNPLLPHKDEDPLCRSSSSDSFSDNENHHLEDSQTGATSVNDEGRDLQLCAICFDAQKDSFFIPCGHCVACFKCSTRIAETSAACPICRRRTKRVQRIYTV